MSEFSRLDGVNSNGRAMPVSTRRNFLKTAAAGAAATAAAAVNILGGRIKQPTITDFQMGSEDEQLALRNEALDRGRRKIEWYLYCHADNLCAEIPEIIGAQPGLIMTYRTKVLKESEGLDRGESATVPIRNRFEGLMSRSEVVPISGGRRMAIIFAPQDPKDKDPSHRVYVEIDLLNLQELPHVEYCGYQAPDYRLPLKDCLPGNADRQTIARRLLARIGRDLSDYNKRDCDIPSTHPRVF